VHPALSVIFLTTLIGAGQGLFLTVFALELAGELRPWSAGSSFAVWAAAVSLSLLAAGLTASFFHLGHPERAWRAATKWRTSWLSREVLVLPALMAAVSAYGLSHFAGWSGTLWVGAIGALLCVALFVCTGMIYACLKFIQEWHTPYTVINFALFGAASGVLCAAALAARLVPAGLPGLDLAALGLLITSAVLRSATLARNRRLRPRSSLQTAIGVKHPRIVQLAQGFSAGSFNTREFFHGGSQALVARMRLGAWLFGFAVPIALTIAAVITRQAPFWDLAFVAQMLGMGFERWTFFASARHPQNLYYQQAA
jgi:DMSO reductase anchor subunit